MFIDKVGQIVLNEDDICHLYLENVNRDFHHILTDSNIKFDLDIENIPNLKKYCEPTSDFDKISQNTYFIPKEYIDLDIAAYVLSCCETDEELQRAGEELLLFQKHDMFMILKYLKYLVDTMRSNNIVWGVGRGSSVASFVLFLIGVHKINSLYYDIPINEFFKT